MARRSAVSRNIYGSQADKVPVEYSNVTYLYEYSLLFHRGTSEIRFPLLHMWPELPFLIKYSRNLGNFNVLSSTPSPQTTLLDLTS